MAEYSGVGTLLARYVHGPGVDEPMVWYDGAAVSGATRRYLGADHQGSIIVTSDSTGDLIAANRYDTWGISADTNIGRFGYTGQAWLEDIGLYYYRARMYAPELGRFLQTDPIGYEDNLNLYAYVGNDPVNFVDPSGTVDIYFGGGGDSLFGIVRSFAQRQKERIAGSDVPNRQVSILAWGDLRLGQSIARLASRNGEPINIIGHSWGGSTAIELVQLLRSEGIVVNNLITIDPVQRGVLGNIDTSNVLQWTNVFSTSEGHQSDYIADFGRQMREALFQADESRLSEQPHGNFPAMMGEIGANGLLDGPYWLSPFGN